MQDVRENRYWDWTKAHLVQAKLNGVHIWVDGTNGCYWVSTVPFEQGIEFQILRRAKQYCEFFGFTILGCPAPSSLLYHREHINNENSSD